jgi:hypothetical protein
MQIEVGGKSTAVRVAVTVYRAAWREFILY